MRHSTPASAAPGETPMSRRTAYGFAFDALEGPKIELSNYAGHPLLIVNTASRCGYTPQFAGLQELWTRFHGDGLTIIGVPSNDFGGQEPGGVQEIAETAQHQYGVAFPIAAKTVVRGADAHPFYKWAASERPDDLPHWNFHKYLIGTDGYIAEVFATEIEPTDVRVIAAISRQLNAAPHQSSQHS
jgi:glutathione peroxidase